MRKLIHLKYVYTGGDGQHHKGADAAIQVGEMYINAFPDLQVEITHKYVTGNIVITEYRAKGIHKGSDLVLSLKIFNQFTVKSIGSFQMGIVADVFEQD